MEIKKKNFEQKNIISTLRWKKIIFSIRALI